MSSSPIPSNFVGLSLNFPNIYNDALSSSLFADLIKNSWVFGSTRASWGVSLKMQYPVGYKWDCPMNWFLFPPATCTLDVKPYYPTISTFFNSVANSHEGLSLGVARGDVMISSTDFSFQNMFFQWYFDFLSTIGYVGAGQPAVELFDKADTYDSINLTRQSYDIAAFES